MENNFEQQLRSHVHLIIDMVQNLAINGYFSSRNTRHYKNDFEKANGSAKKLGDLAKKAWKDIHEDVAPITTKEARSIANFDLSNLDEY